MNEYLSKPVKADLLLEKALQVLKKNQLKAHNSIIDLRYLREVSVWDAEYFGGC